MNILYIWDSDYPWDVRVEKICNSLAKAGHIVHIASRNLKCKATCEEVNSLVIHRIPTIKMFNYLYSFPFFANPVWLNFTNKIVKKMSIDLIIVRDLPLAITGIWVAKKNRIPCIFDMAENYVALLKDIWKKRKFSGLNLIVRNPTFACLVQNYVLKHCDHILVVVKESSDFLKSRKVHEKNISIVGNTPQLSKFNENTLSTPSVPDLSILSKMRFSFTAVYTGGIQMGRGIQLVLESIDKILKQIPDFYFVIVGNGYAVDRLKKLAQDLKVGSYVHWTGWVEHDFVYQYIKNSKVGLIPHITSEHVNTTIPNKIFDYMALGIPVVTSDAVPMKRIVEEENCGLVFRNGNTTELVNTILKIKNSTINFGEIGKTAIYGKYNWSIDEMRLNDAVAKCKNYVDTLSENRILASS
jgi:glycosyltransferase involved in cell wall biosynthesis